jgi:hypothetical protein
MGQGEFNNTEIIIKNQLNIYCFLHRVNTIQRNTKALLYASKEVGLEVNPEKTKYMLVSRCQKAGRTEAEHKDRE